MKVTFNPQTNNSFTAKTISVAQARRVVEIIHTEFPHNSDTFFNALRQSGVKISNDFYDTMVSNLRALRKDWEEATGFNKILTLLKGVKKYKLANCSENTDLSDIGVQMNGFDGFWHCGLKTTKKTPLDHCVLANVSVPDNCHKMFAKDGYIEVKKELLIAPRENTIIIDSWLSDADTGINMMKKYKNEYNKYIKASDSHFARINGLPLNRYNYTFAKDEQIFLVPERRVSLNPKEKQILKRKYPELLFENVDENKLNRMI